MIKPELTLKRIKELAKNVENNQGVSVNSGLEA